MRKTWFIIALAVVLAASLVAYGQQPTTGTLAGKVLDNDGKPLPGATITIEGPLGTQAIQSDAEGDFAARFLPAGTYKVKIEMAGFNPVLYSKVGVSVAQTTRITAKLNPGKTEEVTVTSATPMMDVKRAGVVTSFKTEQSIQTLPIGRNFTDAVAFAPGVVSGLGTGAGNYSIGGSSGLENSYIIDGVNITDSGYGGVGTYSIVFGSLGSGITTDFLEEVQVKTAGFEAEYGQALGGVITGVVKSGTNDLSGAVRFYYTPKSMEASGNRVSLPNGAVNVIEADTKDIGIQAGGPLIKDRAYWFAAFNPVKNSSLTTIESINNPILALNPTTSVTYPTTNPFAASTSGGKEISRTANNYAAKFNFIATPNHRFELTAFGDPSDGDGRSGVTAAQMVLTGLNASLQPVTPKTPATYAQGGRQSSIDYGAHQQSLKYNGLFGSDFFIEGQVNHRKNEFTESSTVNDWQYTDSRITREFVFGKNPNLPGFVTLTAGGAGFVGPTTDETWDYALKVTKTIGNHEIKAGVQYYDLEYAQPSVYSGPTFTAQFPNAAGGFIPIQSTSGALITVVGGIPGCTSCVFSTGNPSYRATRARFNNSEAPVTGTDLAFFVQDTWSINDKWTLKAGLRTASQKLNGAGNFSFPLSRVAGGFSTDSTFYAAKSYKFKTELSPRLGITFDPSASGKDKIYTNYARYFQRIPADLAVRQFSNEIGISRMTFRDPYLTAIASRTVFTQGFDPGEIASGTRLPYVDEWTVGWQHMLRPDLSVEIRGIYRKQGRVLEDVQYSTMEAIQNYYFGYYAATDPFPGFGTATFGAYVLANPGENTTGDFGNPERDYKAMEIEVNKRLSDNWQLTANYRYSKLRGNYEGLFRNDNGQSDPNITSLFDFPNSPMMRGQYQSGILNTDRPHVMHILGTYFFDNGLELGAGLTWQSGVPRTPLLAHPNYQNGGELPGQNPLYYDVFNLDANGNWQLSDVCTPTGAQFGECFLAKYDDSPRGSFGRTPDSADIDLHIGYQKKFSKVNMKLTLDFFNVFNSQEITALDDTVETQASVPNPNFNKIIGYQAPRTARFAVILDF